MDYILWEKLIRKWIKKMSVIKKFFPAVLLLAFLGACSSLHGNNGEIKRYDEPRFADFAPIGLKVSRVDVISEFTPTFTRPNVEHLFPVSIEKTARLWAKDRLSADDFSSDAVAEFIIKDASVTEETEKSEKLFYKDRIVYRANLSVILRITDHKNQSKAQTEIDAWRELIIPADTDIAEKEKYWTGMVNKLFDEFNAKMESNIYQYLNLYVVNNSVIQNYD